MERGIPLSRVASIGIASAGPLDARAGMVLEAPNIEDWENVPLVEIARDEFGVPVALQRDANAAALAEHHWGCGQGVDDMVYITVSTGVGGGLILGGRLYTGAGGTAGEIGHTVVDMNGPECGEGHRGCVEAMASGTAIARTARRRIAAGEETTLAQMDLERITAKEVKEAALRGDRMCREIFHEAATVLGIATTNLANLLSPALAAFGGGVMQEPDLMLDTIRGTVRRNAFRRPAEVLRIERARLGQDVTLRGTILIAMEACGAVSSG